MHWCKFLCLAVTCLCCSSNGVVVLFMYMLWTMSGMFRAHLILAVARGVG